MMVCQMKIPMLYIVLITTCTLHFSSLHALYVIIMLPNPFLSSSSFSPLFIHFPYLCLGFHIIFTFFTIFQTFLTHIHSLLSLLHNLHGLFS